MPKLKGESGFDVSKKFEANDAEEADNNSAISKYLNVFIKNSLKLLCKSSKKSSYMKFYN